MKNIRVIARLDIKVPNLIKPMNLEGVRVVGDPREFARRYYERGIDEIIYMDVVATLYGRNSLNSLIAETAKAIFVPITVGGGIRSLEDVDSILRAGADKVAINTAAIQSPAFIAEVAKRFGSQSTVLSIEAKQKGDRQWEVYTDGGRNKTGRDVVEWAKEAESLGAGEILLTSVDREGLCQGFDIELVKAVTQVVSIPVIASGGMGSLSDASDVIQQGDADGVAIAHRFHYNVLSVIDVKHHLIQQGYLVREVAYENSTHY